MFIYGPNAPEGGVEYTPESCETQTSDSGSTGNSSSSTDYSGEIASTLSGDDQ